MKNLILLLCLVAGLALVGCSNESDDDKLTPSEAQQKVGLSDDQVGKASGSNAVAGADGSTTSVLPENDMESFGLKLYPRSTIREGNAFQKTNPRDVTIYYTLLTSDPAKNVLAYYAKELKVDPKEPKAKDSLVSGKLANGHSAVVTVIDEGESGSRIEVQILRARTEKDK